MSKPQSVVNLDPIDRKARKNPGVIGRAMITRHYSGKGIKSLPPYGHYLFCGRQGGGKTLSLLWYYEYLNKRYKRKGFQTSLFTNLGIGHEISKFTIHPTIVGISYDPKSIHFILIDEIQAYFPKDTKDLRTLQEIDKLVADFSQLRKRQIFVLSTAQIYGRVNKPLREQCLYMINCRKSRLTGHIVNDFIDGDDILCDDQGRWSGTPSKIMVHGLPKTDFDTHRIIIP